MTVVSAPSPLRVQQSGSGSSGIEQALPFLDTPVPKCQVGESAAYVVLLAAGPRGQAAPQALAHLARAAECRDHLLGNFATEVLRRAGGSYSYPLRERTLNAEHHLKIRKLESGSAT